MTHGNEMERTQKERTSNWGPWKLRWKECKRKELLFFFLPDFDVLDIDFQISFDLVFEVQDIV